MMGKSIFLIEDDELLNKLLVDQLTQMGYLAEGFINWSQAQRQLSERDPDLVILDGRLPDAGWETILPRLVSKCPVIMLTAYGNVPQAVSAMRAGVADYLIKPVGIDELEMVVKRTFEAETLRQNFQFCKNKLRSSRSKLLVGHSPALAEVDALIDAVSPTGMTVLVHGESGVGKELVAHELHDRSDRSEHNFVALDCCTLQETLFESELFGHERGSFTGADKKKIGLIEAAENGTLFLDEIGEIGPALQAKLLRVLETGTYRRVGGTKDLSANVRIVAATNRDLEKMVKEGEFRPDLFFRLNAFTILMPPLRSRREDIPDLVDHFIANHDFSRRVVVKRVTVGAMRQLVAYDWPGNVRELKNVIERAIILSRGQAEIRPEHLAFCQSASDISDLGMQLHFPREPSLEDVEKIYLQKLLDKYSGHRSKVAEVMGVSERNIYRLIVKYGISE
jgi:DNA-binding NtrC family response regulator